MAPILELLHWRRALDFGSPAREFRSQWTNPGDVFSLLLILGGDIVGLALAQLVGSYFTPVAFSFGRHHRRRRDTYPPPWHSTLTSIYLHM